MHAAVAGDVLSDSIATDREGENRSPAERARLQLLARMSGGIPVHCFFLRSSRPAALSLLFPIT
jgi:hypothetical protein